MSTIVYLMNLAYSFIIFLKLDLPYKPIGPQKIKQGELKKSSWYDLFWGRWVRIWNKYLYLDYKCRKMVIKIFNELNHKNRHFLILTFLYKKTCLHPNSSMLNLIFKSISAYKCPENSLKVLNINIFYEHSEAVKFQVAKFAFH